MITSRWHVTKILSLLIYLRSYVVTYVPNNPAVCNFDFGEDIITDELINSFQSRNKNAVSIYAHGFHGSDLLLAHIGHMDMFL